MNTPTPHINAKLGDFAKTVLMPGDPLRAKFIADNLLTNPVLVNNVRGVQGYTGTYKGKRVSVMASGMGIPSIGIYSYELYNFYDVTNIIRIGSAGAMREDIKVRDIVIGQGACTNSNFLSQYGLCGTFAPISSYKLLEKAVQIAKEKSLPYKVGNLYSSDTFYDASASTLAWAKMGALAVEMEAAGLYATAAYCNKHALAICTISDNLVTGEALSSADRQNTFLQMMELALELAE
ncbi:MAG: purine-nucleoside phosphorylase [Clostridia bacterium]